MGPQMIPMAMAIAGTLMQKKAQDDAANERKDALNRSLLEDDQYQKKASALVDENSQQYDPQAREKAAVAAEETAANSLTSNLVSARDNAPQSAIGGKVSNDYTLAKAKSKSDELEHSSKIARLMAKVRAPSDMRFNESLTNADYASQAGGVGSDRRSRANVNQQLINSAGDGGGMMSLIGQGLASAGTVMAGNKLMSGDLFYKGASPYTLSSGVSSLGLKPGGGTGIRFMG